MEIDVTGEIDDSWLSEGLEVLEEKIQKIIYSIYNNQYDEEEVSTIFGNIWYSKCHKEYPSGS